MPRILVVDDELICTTLLSTSLTEQGFDVRTSATGEEAIDIGLQFLPDVLVSDWKLAKKIDGIEVARTLQAHRKETAVILFSGLPADELESRARDVRIYRVLEKPCGIEEITAIVQDALRDRG